MADARVRPSHTLLVFCLATWAIPHADQDAQRTFESATCRVSFHYPTDWVVREDTAAARWGETCGFVIQPVAWDSLLVLADSVSGAYTIWLRVVTLPFEDAAEAHGFERRDEGWIVLGRQGLESPGDAIARRGGRGVRGTAEDGCHRIGGGYVGLCPLHKAVIGRDTLSVVMSADELAADVFEKILPTLQFRP